VGEGVGDGVGDGVGEGEGEGEGDGDGVGDGVASAVKVGLRVGVTTAMAVPDGVTAGLPLKTPDSASSTSTARPSTATRASQSLRAFERRWRVRSVRRIVPVRRGSASDCSDSGKSSPVGIGWAGYSRAAKGAVEPPGARRQKVG
jgi:hypothetical protein